MKGLMRMAVLSLLLGLGTPAVLAQEPADDTAAMTPPAVPAPEPPQVEEERSGPTVTISVSDDEDDGDAEDDKSHESRLERKVKMKIADVLEAALMDDDVLSEEEQAELREELKELRGEVEITKKVVKDGASKKEKKDKDRNMSVHVSDDVPLAGMALGGLAILLIFGTPIMLVAAVLYWGYRKRRLAHDTINQYLASGKEIPEEIMQNLFKDAKPKNNLHKGMVMCGLGFGIFLCFAIIGSIEAASFGLIFLFIGLAQLLIWKLEKDAGNQRGQG